MHLLVINSGSSSIKFSVFASEDKETGALPVSLFEGEVSGIGSGKASFQFRDAEGQDLSGDASSAKAESSMEAIGLVVEAVSREGCREWMRWGIAWCIRVRSWTGMCGLLDESDPGPGGGGGVCSAA